MLNELMKYKQIKSCYGYINAKQNRTQSKNHYQITKGSVNNLEEKIFNSLETYKMYEFVCMQLSNFQQYKTKLNINTRKLGQMQHHRAGFNILVSLTDEADKNVKDEDKKINRIDLIRFARLRKRRKKQNVPSNLNLD